MYKSFFLPALLLSCFRLWSQSDTSHLSRVNPWYSRLTVSCDPGLNTGNKQCIRIGVSSFTSVALESSIIPGATIKLFRRSDSGLQPVKPGSNHEYELFPTGNRITGFYLYPQTQDTLYLDPGSYRGTLVFHLLYSPSPITSQPDGRLFKRTDPCDRPESISYKTWRQGLPDPVPPRETTPVQHLVVHHSAGSNSDTNYLDVVRNIYLLHTQVNGWDDIGYNFLIAPDGTVFLGRDPQGAGDEDNILGAHFCGKNQNTMGVCLLGSFSDRRPTSRATESLIYLLAWKLKKEQLDGLGNSLHPAIGGSPLNTICGHRDGCSTACPGDSLYHLLNYIKKEAVRVADSCGLKLSYQSPKDGTCEVFPNPAANQLTIRPDKNTRQWILRIFDLSGREAFKREGMQEETFDLHLPEGLYFYKLNMNSDLIKGKLIIK